MRLIEPNTLLPTTGKALFLATFPFKQSIKVGYILLLRTVSTFFLHISSILHFSHFLFLTGCSDLKTPLCRLSLELLLLWNHHLCRCEFAYTNNLEKVVTTHLYTIERECWSVPDVVHKLAHFIAPLRPPQVKNRWLNAWQNPKWKENQCHLQSAVLEQQPTAFAVHKKIPLWWFNSR